MTFDRLLFIDRLREAGIDEPVARAHADALREALLETVATKADLNDAVATLDRKFADLDRKIEAVRADLTAKIEITSRDLTIRTGAGLVLLGSILIAVKFFG